jgi:hypothetical protein
MIVAFTPKETLFVSDTFRYYLKEGTSEDVLDHRLEINHSNLKEHVEHYETDCPKIHKVTGNTGLICGGDGRFSDIPEGLNEGENTVTQILQRLKRKGNINAYWSCHIAQLGKLTSIIYKNGEIETTEQTTDNIWFDSFAPEIKEIFFKKYINFFYLATTQEKIKIINEFFKEVTALFGGLAGGKAEIAILNEQGFQWVRSQNFTAYSMNWCPEKIETESAVDIAISDTFFTDILELPFECESTMLLFISAYVNGYIYNNSANPAAMYKVHRLLLDGNYVPVTYCTIGGYCLSASHLDAPYSIHTVAIVVKGSHVLKIQMCAVQINSIAYAIQRRLTILKGFYQGGST